MNINTIKHDHKPNIYSFIYLFIYLFIRLYRRDSLSCMIVLPEYSDNYTMDAMGVINKSTNLPFYKLELKTKFFFFNAIKEGINVLMGFQQLASYHNEV